MLHRGPPDLLAFAQGLDGDGKMRTRTKIRKLTKAQWKALVEKQAQSQLGISATEFEQRWKAGEFSDENACPEAVRVAMLLPVGW
jgi:hypothetical protein